MCLSGLPALKVRLAASIKLDENKWAWLVDLDPRAAAVWDVRTFEVAVDDPKATRAVP